MTKHKHSNEPESLVHMRNRAAGYVNLAGKFKNEARQWHRQPDDYIGRRLRWAHGFMLEVARELNTQADAKEANHRERIGVQNHEPG